MKEDLAFEAVYALIDAFATDENINARNVIIRVIDDLRSQITVAQKERIEIPNPSYNSTVMREFIKFVVEASGDLKGDGFTNLKSFVRGAYDLCGSDKIKVIKLLREMSAQGGKMMGLRESKDIVDIALGLPVTQIIKE